MKNRSILCKIGWKEKVNIVVGAGRPQRAIKSLTALFLKGRRAGKGRKAGGVVSGSSPLPLLPLPACPGTGKPSAVLSKSGCVF